MSMADVLAHLWLRLSYNRLEPDGVRFLTRTKLTLHFGHPKDGNPDPRPARGIGMWFPSGL